MAISVLELNEALKEKRSSLAELEKVSFETRETELTERIKTASDEERDSVEADIDALNSEKATHESKVADLKKAVEDLEREIAEFEAEEPSNEKEIIERKTENMSDMITRDSHEYVDAFARYIKTGSDKELRSLLSENASEEAFPTGVAVPSLVESVVKHAWEQTGIMSLVRKTYIKGNVKVGFEISATGAVVHEEGADAPTEEDLQLGIVTMYPESIKKWITISDEAMDLGGADFLNYIYAELTYRIAKKVEDELIARIVEAPTTNQAALPGEATITAAPALGTVASAIANLSDEATNPVIVMNKLTYAAFKQAQYEANYGADIFEGLKVVFNNTLPAYSAASSGNTYMIVGDFGVGAQANFPNGETISIKMDDLSLAEKDLVKLVGRCFVAARPVAPFAFTRVKKA